MDSARDINKALQDYRLLETLWTLDKICLHWEVEVEPYIAEIFARRCEDYNEATQENLSKLLKKIDLAVPRIEFGPTNPHTGDPAYKVILGNACSRLVVIMIRKRLLPEDMNYGDIVALFQAAASQCGCDEFKLLRNDHASIEFRFWWD